MARQDARPAEAPSPEAALAHPSRRRVADALAAAPSGLTAFELSERLGLHHNAVRQHLTVLERAGVVSSAPDAPRGRGRPSVRWRLAYDQPLEAAGHRELVRLLVNLVRRAGAGHEEAEAVGLEEGRLIGQEGPEAVTAALARLGFAPRELAPARARRRGRSDLRLGNCPFRDAVEQPGGEVICSLHRGLVRGLLERSGTGAVLEGFEPKDPRLAGCRVLLDGLGERP